MCYNPIHIRNLAYPRQIAALPYIDVPCGSCLECQNVQKLDYLIRCIALYKALPANKWSFFFTTLTFAPEHLPSQEFWSKDGNGDWYSLGVHKCFDHRLIHRFCKSLRQYYKRKFSVYESRLNPETHRMKKYLVNSPDKMNLPHVLVTCEFGENGTQRPHYHLIMAIPEVISWKQFQNKIKTLWPYGFNESFKIVQKDGQSYERSDYSAMEYVCKYVNKNSGFLPEIFKKKNIYCEIGMFNVLPRVFTTNGFGSFLESVLSHDDYCRGTIRYDVNGSWRTYKIPNYFIRRHFVRTEQTVSKVDVYESNTPWIPGTEKLITKRKVESVTWPTEEYKDIVLKRRIDKIKTAYVHCWSDFVSSKDFNNFLLENGFPYDFDDCHKAFLKLDSSKFCDSYLKVVQFPEVRRVQSDKLSPRSGIDVFNDYTSDFLYRKRMMQKTDWHDCRLDVDHLYSTVDLFADFDTQVLAALIDMWHVYDNQNREMRAIARKNRYIEYCKLHGIRKKSLIFVW